ncbi:hypothetical protein ACE38W_09645 [Chitinophaga sp. Hz27]|uniref:hypothetical protein n=1 Tax=Chitinophaga sp. Hz27 TaxID=3347169 RepID=UPI0035D714A0
MKRFVLSAVSCLFLITSITAQTQTPAPQGKPTVPVVHARQNNQQQRIANGVASGELTPKETAHLEKREEKIQAEKKADKADGKITKKERQKLRQDQNSASKAIYNQKHDAQKRH